MTNETRDSLFRQVIRRLGEYDLQSVADYAGVSVATLYCWLNGKVMNPHSHTLFNVAEALNIEITWADRNGLRAVA